MSENIKAFPNPYGVPVPQEGMDLRDWFAGKAPLPSSEEISREMTRDKNLNPYNESHKPKLRCQYEIIADLAYEYADAMIEARKK